MALENDIDPRYGRVVRAGTLAGLAGAFTYAVMWVMTRLFLSYDSGQLGVEGLVRFTIAWGLGLPFSLLAWHIGRMPVLLGVIYALVIGLVTWQFGDAATVIPLIAYGVVTGLVWRNAVMAP